MATSVIMVAGAGAILLGMAVPVASYLGNAGHIDLRPAYPGTSAAAAFVFGFAGVLLLCGGLGVRSIVLAGGVVISVTGLLAVLERLLATEIGLSRLVSPGNGDGGLIMDWIELGPLLCFLLFGIGLVLVSIHPLRRWRGTVSMGLGVLIVVQALVVLLGYAVGMDEGSRWAEAPGMSLLTGIGILFLGAGLLGLAWRWADARPGKPKVALVPLVVLLAMSAASLTVWHDMRVDEDARMHERALLTQAMVRRSVEDRLNARGHALSRLARRWAAAQSGDAPNWPAEAAVYIDPLIGYDCIAWIGPGGEVREIAAAQGADHALDTESLLAFREQPAPHADEHTAERQAYLICPAPDGDALLVWVPQGNPGAESGAIVGRLRLKPLLEGVLDRSDIAPGYHITVSSEGRTLYQRDGDAIVGTTAAAEAPRGELMMRGGATLDIAVAPRDALVAAAHSPMGGVVLWGGVLLGVFFAVAQWLITRNLRQLTLNKRLSAEVAARTEAEDALRQANQALSTTNNELQDFVYTVSHDLKSPLVTQVGFIGCIREDLAAGAYDEVNDSVDRLERATKRMEQCIDDLLELSRIGRIRHDPETIDLNELVREVAADLAGPLSEAGATLEVQGDLPEITADRPRMVELFENLITNAIKYGCPGGGTITVGSRIEGGEKQVYVSDQGPGIPAEYHEKVFGLFQRLSSGKVGGTGIGLAIVRRIMEVHGGRVWLESAQDAGATFWLAFKQAAFDETETQSVS